MVKFIRYSFCSLVANCHMEYDKIDLIDAKAEKLLQQYKLDPDIGLYTNAFWLLVVIFFIALTLLYVLDGYQQLTFAIALLSCIAYRLIINKASKSCEALSLYNTFENHSKAEYTLYKLRYLSALIGFKASRIRALRLFYMVCFPVWLVMLSKLVFFRETNFNTVLILLVSAYIIGGVFWYFFYARFIQDLEFKQQDIIEVIGVLQQEKNG